MLKKFFIIFAVSALSLYVIAAILFLGHQSDEASCKGIDILISGNGHNVLSNANLEQMLKKRDIHPTGKNMSQIDCNVIENAINEYSLVEECQCYKTHKNLVGIRITCKEPIMQIFDKNEKEFFIDKQGDIIEGIHNTIYLPVASGHIEREMATKELLKIAQFLQDNEFWNEQTEQVYFTSRKEIVLVPRVGNHTIELGKADNIDEKLDKLKEFYKKGLNNIGWNKYSNINIEFDNKIIGTKR